jgi:hypothetical protein
MRRTYWEVILPGKDSGERFDDRDQAFSAAVDTLPAEGTFMSSRTVRVEERVLLESADICTRSFTVMVSQQALIREAEPASAPGISADYADSAE